VRRSDQLPDPLVSRRFEQIWTSPPSTSGRNREFGHSGTGTGTGGGFADGTGDEVNAGAADDSVAAPWASGTGHSRAWSADPLSESLGGAVAPGHRPHAGERALAALSPHRRAVKALAVVAAFVVATSAFLAWRARPSTVSVATGPIPAATAGLVGAPPTVLPSASTTNAATVLVVAVEGKVRHPGLVRLPVGSRVADAIEAAGGAEPGTDLSFVNLAQKVVDGELIVIGMTPPPGVAATTGSNSSGSGGSGVGGSGGPAQPGAPINLNTATEADLDTLPGIGPALAQRIIDYRSQHGAFRSVDELRNVSGIGDAKFAEIKDLVTV
jgi:competence protein ComEA